MLLIRKTVITITKSGNKLQWAIFKCPNSCCGREVERQLSNGLSNKSCGCNKIKHGESHTRLYKVWHDMKQRILNPKVKEYKNYGGRGITICPEWVESYIEFRDWSLSNGYVDDLVIDRKDNDGNYEPSNCQWISQLENNRKKPQVILTQQKANEIRTLYATGKYTQQELAEMYNVSLVTISNIINNKRWKKEN